MTSNVGTEYINLKQAKYNRDMREKRAASVSAQPRAITAARSSATGAGALEHTASHTAHAALPAAAKSVQRAYGTPAGERYIDRDLFGEIAAEAGRALARRRREAARARACETKYVRKNVRTAQPLPISLIGYMVVFAAIAMFLVLGNSKIHEATLRVDTLKSAIAQESERADQLASSLNQRKDVSYIENYAENVLGMVKSTDVAKRYVSISGEDKIVVSGADRTAQTGTSLLLDSVG